MSASAPVPHTPGFYWAQWRISDNDHELPPVGTWEVVEVFQNGQFPDEAEYLMVAVAGVEKPESLENFYWAPAPLVPPEAGA